VSGSFEPTVTTYGPFHYELALATKWLISGTSGAAEAAASAADGWAYLNVLDDPARTPLTMISWIHTMRVVSAWCGVLTVLILARTARRLSGPEAASLVAWLAALAPGLVQVSHFYTPDGLLLLFEVMVLDAATLLLDRPSWQRATYAGLGIGLILATKLTGALVALLVPWAIYARREHPGPGALVRACLSRPTWIAVIVSLATYALFCPWAVMRGPDYFSGGGGPTSGAFMLGTLYETDFGFYDWRFAYLDQPRGLTFFTSLLPYAIGGPAVLAGLAGLFLADRRARLIAWGALLPSFALVAGWTVLTIRYSLPLVPPLLLAASAGLARGLASSRVLGGRALEARLPRVRLHASHLAQVATALVLSLSLARGTAWTLMFTEDDPRALASRWIAEHAEDGDVVVAESDRPYTAPLGASDEPMGALPWEMPNLVIVRLFGGGELGAAVPAHTTRTLREARYLVISDWFLRRGLHPAAVTRAPEQARFYRELLAGRLGFTEVARFDREPRLGPLRWSERDEEQLAVCFDHCPVRIFERTGTYRSPF